MSWIWSAGGWLNILSGALVAGLGLFLLVANPRKDWNRLFSVFAVLWGTQIMASNAIRVTDDERTALVTSEIGLALVLPLYFFLVAFAISFPRPEARLARSPLVLPALALPAVASLAVLFVKPSWMLVGVTTAAEGGYTVQWGPAFPYLIAVPFYAALLFVLFLMMRRLGEARSPIERTQVSFVLGAFGMFVAYNIPVLLFLFGGAALGVRPASMAARTVAVMLALLMLASFVMLSVLAARLARSATASGIEGERRAARRVLLALGAGFAAALAVIGLQATGGPRVDAVGIVRTLSVALIVYAIARYQLFDIDLRVKSAATTASAALLGVAAAGAGWIALRSASVPDSLGVPVTTLVAVGAFVPLFRASARVADRVAPRVSREGDHLLLRKLEVYRASIEQHLREGREPAADDPWLAEVRARLGLTERDHVVVVSLALSGGEAARRAPVLEPGATAFGRYHVETVLGEGAFGRVLRARDRVLDRTVVIKELQARWRANPAMVRTFLREARIAGSLHHPNVVGVIEIEQHGEDRYIVMEHLDGGTLQDRLAHGALPEAEAVRIARGILSGLEAAHAKGVVHRDVKPANVLLGRRGEVKLADFGIAQLSADDPQRTISGLTSAGFQPGTLQYMSPEQARGAPVDARSDLYAVGAILHRMLTGRPHVDLAGLDEFTARTRIAAGPTPPPAGDALPPWARQALARALAPDPARRYPTARAFAADLPSTARLKPQGAD